MKPVTDIDLIFYGNRKSVNFSFIDEMFREGTDVEFTDPEDVSANSYSDIIGIIRRERVILFSIQVKSIVIDFLNEVIFKPFVSVYVEGEKVELLIFFDMKEMVGDFDSRVIELMRIWMSSYSNEYVFDRFRCQIAGADKDDQYYFDDAGFGELYYKLD